MTGQGLERMVSKTLLVGMVYVDSNGIVVERVQFAGVVTSVDPLVEIDIGDEEPFTLPPDPDAYDVADPGEYRLRASGDVVVDPDFITSWRVTTPG